MTTVPVRGGWISPPPAAGEVWFTARPAVVYDTVTMAFIAGQTRKATVDPDTGNFEIALHATDDPTLEPVNWTYQVRYLINGSFLGEPYDIDVPIALAGTGMELGDVAPVSPSDGDPTAFVTLTAFTEISVPLMGGTTGQVLAKASNADYDFDWVPQSGGGGGAVTSVAGRTGAVVLTKADVGLTNVDNTSDATKPISAAQQAALDLKAPLNSPDFGGTPKVPTAAGGTNTTQAASTAFVSAAVALAVSGLLELQGNLDASANPNYPAASKGDLYYVSVAGKVGGASGVSVDVGDAVVAKADNAGGTQAAVGTSWFVLEHNLAGALLSANNLSDLASAATARTNLGLGTAATAPSTAFEAAGAVAAKTLADVAATVTATGNAVIGKHNPADATAGSVVITVANAATAGQLVSVEKVDATANTVTISANFRGTPGSLPLTLSHESVVLLGKADGSWWPFAGHKTKSSLDALYQAADADLTAIAALATQAYGRGVLTATDRAALLAYIGVGDTWLASGNETMNREFITSNAVPSTSQALRLAYFTARSSFTATQIKMFSGATAAGATPTLCQAGIYSIAANGDGTLVASIASDTTLFAGATLSYTRALLASLGIVAGSTYAVGLLVVTAAAAPSYLGQAPTGMAANENLLSPRVAGSITGQATMPASFLNASVGISGGRPYAVVLP